MLLRFFSLLVILSLSSGLDADVAMETALLVNNKPLDLSWEKCLNTVSCIKTNVIDRVSDLEAKVGNASFGAVPAERGSFISLGSKLKMKMIRRDDGSLAFRFVADEHAVDSGRGHFAEQKKAALIGFALILFVLGVVSTTLKVNVFLALLGVAIGKILLLYVYTEHLLHHKHHHHGRPGLHIHRAPVHNYKVHPVQVVEQPVVVEQEYHHDVHHEPYHHDHYGHHDHYDHDHDDWIFGKKKKSLQL